MSHNLDVVEHVLLFLLRPIHRISSQRYKAPVQLSIKRLQVLNPILGPLVDAYNGKIKKKTTFSFFRTQNQQQFITQYLQEEQPMRKKHKSNSRKRQSSVQNVPSGTISFKISISNATNVMDVFNKYAKSHYMQFSPVVDPDYKDAIELNELHAFQLFYFIKCLFASSPSEMKQLLRIKLLSTCLLSHLNQDPNEPHFISQLLSLIDICMSSSNPNKIIYYALYCLESMTTKHNVLNQSSLLIKLFNKYKSLLVPFHPNHASDLLYILDAIFVIYTHCIYNNNTGLITNSSLFTQMMAELTINDISNLPINQQYISYMLKFRCCHFVDLLIYTQPSLYDQFKASNGITILSSICHFEISNLIQNESNLAQTVATTAQSIYTKAILKFIQHLIASNGTNINIRHLLETNIPTDLNTYLVQYKDDAICGILFNIISTFIHVEPTCYSIIYDLQIIQNICKSLNNRIPMTMDGLQHLPKLLSAISLSSNGLDLLISNNVISNLIHIYHNPAYISDLNELDVSKSLGIGIEELIRHQPSIKTLVINELVQVIHYLLKVPSVDDPLLLAMGGISTTTTLFKDIIPLPIATMIEVYSKFMSGFFQNQQHSSSFIQSNGLQLLHLFKCQVPYSFASSKASYFISHVIHTLCEHDIDLIINEICTIMSNIYIKYSSLLDISASQLSTVLITPSISLIYMLKSWYSYVGILSDIFSPNQLHKHKIVLSNATVIQLITIHANAIHIAQLLRNSPISNYNDLAPKSSQTGILSIYNFNSIDTPLLLDNKPIPGTLSVQFKNIQLFKSLTTSIHNCTTSLLLGISKLSTTCSDMICANISRYLTITTDNYTFIGILFYLIFDQHGLNRPLLVQNNIHNMVIHGLFTKINSLTLNNDTLSKYIHLIQLLINNKSNKTEMKGIGLDLLLKYINSNDPNILQPLLPCLQFNQGDQPHVHDVSYPSIIKWLINHPATSATTIDVLQLIPQCPLLLQAHTLQDQIQFMINYYTNTQLLEHINKDHLTVPLDYTSTTSVQFTTFCIKHKLINISIKSDLLLLALTNSDQSLYTALIELAIFSNIEIPELMAKLQKQFHSPQILNHVMTICHLNWMTPMNHDNLIKYQLQQGLLNEYYTCNHFMKQFCHLSIHAVFVNVVINNMMIKQDRMVWVGDVTDDMQLTNEQLSVVVTLFSLRGYPLTTWLQIVSELVKYHGGLKQHVISIIPQLLLMTDDMKLVIHILCHVCDFTDVNVNSLMIGQLYAALKEALSHTTNVYTLFSTTCDLLLKIITNNKHMRTINKENEGGLVTKLDLLISSGLLDVICGTLVQIDANHPNLKSITLSCYKLLELIGMYGYKIMDDLIDFRDELTLVDVQVDMVVDEEDEDSMEMSDMGDMEMQQEYFNSDESLTTDNTMGSEMDEMEVEEMEEVEHVEMESHDEHASVSSESNDTHETQSTGNQSMTQVLSDLFGHQAHQHLMQDDHVINAMQHHTTPTNQTLQYGNRCKLIFKWMINDVDTYGTRLENELNLKMRRDMSVDDDPNAEYLSSDDVSESESESSGASSMDLAQINIDPDVLNEIPMEFRQEALMQHYVQHNRQQIEPPVHAAMDQHVLDILPMQFRQEMAPILFKEASVAIISEESLRIVITTSINNINKHCFNKCVCHLALHEASAKIIIKTIIQQLFNKPVNNQSRYACQLHYMGLLLHILQFIVPLSGLMHEKYDILINGTLSTKTGVAWLYTFNKQHEILLHVLALIANNTKDVEICQEETPIVSYLKMDLNSKLMQYVMILCEYYRPRTVLQMAIKKEMDLMDIKTQMGPMLRMIKGLECTGYGFEEMQLIDTHKLVELDANEVNHVNLMECLLITSGDTAALKQFLNTNTILINTILRSSPTLLNTSFKRLVEPQYCHVLEFEHKKKWFDNMNKKQLPNSTSIQLSIRRPHIFEDSYHQIMNKQGLELKQGKIQIKFYNEDGIDSGGLTREWYAELSREIFNPNYALFVKYHDTYQPNISSWVNPDHLNFYKFIGRLIGKSIMENQVLDCYFTRSFYKHLLGIDINLSDLEVVDAAYYNSLKWMMENDITGVIEQTFVMEVEEFGKQQQIQLVEDGINKTVTNGNKHEYVQLIVEQKLTHSISDQLSHFKMGFYEIIDKELIRIFNEQELELLISGLPEIDVDDWKNNTEYVGYSNTSPQVQWFWRSVRQLDQEGLAKLLQFITGTSKVPMDGFKGLQGNNGIQKFQIHKDYGGVDRLPVAHTCFNQLDLPLYETYEQLNKQLTLAIHECSTGFGLA